MKHLARLFVEDGGQDLVEYALLIALVVLVTAAGWDAIRAAVGMVYGGTGLDSASSESGGLWGLFGADIQ